MTDLGVAALLTMYKGPDMEKVCLCLDYIMDIAHEAIASTAALHSHQR